MSNFQFLQTHFPEIYREAREAEVLTFTSPKACVIICRSALEKTVNWLYTHDADLHYPYDRKLAALIHEQCFRDILKPSLFREINLIRTLGNNAAHGNTVKPDEALIAVKNLFRFLSFLAIYYAEEEPAIPPFNESLIPTGEEEKEKAEKLRELEARLAQQNEATLEERRQLEARAREIELLQQQLEAQQQQVKERREQRAQTHDIDKEIPLLVSEQLTRKLYIDQRLKEAGWVQLREGYELEYEVQGMPVSTNPTGKGYVDYVLWGLNGKPLAVVEAKRTMADVRKGRHQATLYADCLEKSHGQRPLIYYTNGFETFLWDDTFYPERPVQGFHSQDELQLLIDRRTNRTDLRSFKANENIAGRKYQIEALQRVAETFARTGSTGQLTGGARKALLVMATGSGKTRTAAALVDMLTQCNWVKRVLFLADRNALVTQAKNAFALHLPNLTSIDLTTEKEENSSRLVFSTYPTIMNKIDAVRTNDQRFYGAGHFDLIIIDEAHRSVYQKYGAIFHYFDAMLLGLTATPKKEIDRNTYQLFDIEDDNPTFAYELDEAVKDDFLKPPKSISVPVKFLREGIRYSELSEREKQEYEEKFGDPTSGEAPEEIGSEALNKWLFNTDTVDKVLHYLMRKGIKVEGGDKLGKTIIFAQNHNHAVFIEERFNKNYPEYRGQFLRVIDNYETKAQDLLGKFVDPDVEYDPQIAVSVDMLDTGIDAPRVVNLVFFKRVKSYTKFWQMVGRGTRPCPNLFGPGEDKEHFLIFDYCENLEFFEANPDGIEGKSLKSLTHRIFEMKLDVVMQIREMPEATQEELELAECYTEQLHAQVRNLDESRFMVTMKLRYVKEYASLQRWQNLSRGDVLDIGEHLAGLILPEKDDDELARRFDILMLSLKLALLEGREGAKYIQKIASTAQRLEKKKNIPAVGTHIGMLRELQTDVFWQAAHVKRLDEVRRNMRELVRFLDAENKETVYTTIEDLLDESEVEEKHLIRGYTQLKSYRDRVESFIRKNRHHITIQNLRTNKPITADELQELERMLFDGHDLGSRKDYEEAYGEMPLGKFIRSIVGLDIQAANQAFADFLQAGNLRADQMTFINKIIQYLERNGTIEAAMLFEPPFTDLNDQGLMGVFDDAQSTRIIQLIDRINGNAEVG